MEQNFQTSFIPKKPVVNERVKVSEPVGPLMVISLFILFTVLLASGSLYFYKELRTKNIDQMEKSLALARTKFEAGALSEFQVLDKRLRAGSAILKQHVAVTPIFDVLEKTTMKTVRFTNFSYAQGNESSAPIKITMSGEAVRYRDIALQADLFAKNKNLINPVFSNLTLDPKGNVLFDLEFAVDPALLNYKQLLSKERPQ